MSRVEHQGHEKGVIVSCGSNLPNKNLDNLDDKFNSNYVEWLKNSVSLLHEEDGSGRNGSLTSMHEKPHKLELHLTLDRGDLGSIMDDVDKHRKHWQALKVNHVANRGVVGIWTMIYDEGIEIRLQHGLTMTGLLKYTKDREIDPDCSRVAAKDGDDAAPELLEGQPFCYKTDPTQTLIGWYQERQKNGERLYGCVYGRQENKYHRTHKKDVVSAVKENTDLIKAILQSKRKIHSPIKSGEAKTRGLINFVKMEGRSLQPDPDSGISGQNGHRLWTSAAHLSGIKSFFKGRVGSISQIAGRGRACSRMNHQEPSLRTIDPIPANFSWGDPWISPDKQTPNDLFVINQGACGSCYAIASLYVLQKRSEIQLANRGVDTSNLIPLSATSILSCSFYNQGCDGGYPFLVGKWSSQFGITHSDCEGAYQDHDSPAFCSLSHHTSHFTNDSSLGHAKLVTVSLDQRYEDQIGCGQRERVFAKDYGYIGGCFECATSDILREELFHHGPIVAAIDAPSSLLTYQDGIFDDAPLVHHSSCSASENKSLLSGFEYTDHAIVLVGFGIDHVETAEGGKKSIPYWVARNSWGPKWGNAGYFKLVRGKNLGGVENQGVFVDPDLSRGLLQQLTIAT